VHIGGWAKDVARIKRQGINIEILWTDVLENCHLKDREGN
jgi:hypothetical protein